MKHKGQRRQPQWMSLMFKQLVYTLISLINQKAHPIIFLKSPVVMMHTRQLIQIWFKIITTLTIKEGRIHTHFNLLEIV